MLAVLAFCLAIAVEAPPPPSVSASAVAPAAESCGALLPPPRLPPTALGAAEQGDDRPYEPSIYPETTRMTRIAQRMLATIAAASGAAVIAYVGTTCGT
jgi:hypothetical protein